MFYNVDSMAAHSIFKPLESMQSGTHIPQFIFPFYCIHATNPSLNSWGHYAKSYNTNYSNCNEQKKHFTLEAMESWLYQDAKQVTQFSTRLLGNVSPNFTSMDFSSK
jgi:hypothetical protein